MKKNIVYAFALWAWKHLVYEIFGKHSTMVLLNKDLRKIFNKEGFSKGGKCEKPLGKLSTEMCLKRKLFIRAFKAFILFNLKSS